MARHSDRLKKRGNLWWSWCYVAIVGDDGRVSKEKREFSTGQRDRALAREAARRIERTIVAKAEGPAALTLTEVLARYIAIVETSKRPDTVAFYEKKAKPLLRVMGADCNVLELTMLDSDSYASERTKEGVSGHTISKELGLLRSALRAARKRGLYSGDTDWCLPEYLRNVYVPRETTLTVEQYEAIRTHLSPSRRDYLAAYIGLGLRDGELHRIHVDDVEKTRVRIRGHKGNRAAADRWLQPRPEVMALLRRAADNAEGGLLFRWTNVRRDLGLACDKAGAPRVTPNDLRRTFATWLAESGTPELVVARLMGHTSSAMVRRVYARVGASSTASALRSLPRLTRTVPLTVSDRTGLSGRSERGGRAKPRKRADFMPKGGIEPPTRGFSSRVLWVDSSAFPRDLSECCPVVCLCAEGIR